MPKKSVFKRYAPFIQEYIYKKGWNELYNVQIEAAEAILDSNSDIIIASGTATGKTEAALFPILTDLYRKPSKTISILYISPLKALINDQFDRLTDLLNDSDLPVWPWHGDISQSMKDRTKKAGKGIIQITPESLEALLIRHPEIIKELFSDLRYIIIDEIHSMMGSDRGLQVLSQIERIERLSQNRPRRIGLSATLSDYEQAKYYLSSGHPERVKALGLRSNVRSLGLRVECFPFSIDQDEPDRSLEYLYDRTRIGKSLIFTNSRKEAETLISDLKQMAKNKNDSDIYYIHHGSLSKELRKETESTLKQSNSPVVTAATLTLELGIDIGTLDQTIQIGAPFSCSNFVQRLGRSGRITGKPLMRFINYYKNEPIRSPFNIPWELLRTIAIIELYLNEKWIEPFDLKEKPYSLLIQQTLSILTASNTLMPNELARQVLTLFPFRGKISQDEFRSILKELIKQDIIQQLEDGSLIIGLNGEKIVNHYTFYAIFSDDEAFRVFHKGHEIGSLQEEPLQGQRFFLGGRSWEVVSVNSQAKSVEVIPSQNAQSPTWNSTGININGRIFKKVYEILDDAVIYSYLSPEAAKVLEVVRNFTLQSGILEGIFIDQYSEEIYLFPWCGTREMRTLVQIFKTVLRKELGIKRVNGYYDFIVIKSSLPPYFFIEKLMMLNLELPPSDALLENLSRFNIDKYDDLLPIELQRKAYLRNHLDLKDACQAFNKLTEKLRGDSKTHQVYSDVSFEIS